MKKILYIIMCAVIFVGCTKEHKTYSLAYEPITFSFFEGVDTLAVEIRSDVQWEVFGHTNEPTDSIFFNTLNGDGNEILKITLSENIYRTERNFEVKIKFGDSDSELLPVKITQAKPHFYIIPTPAVQYVDNIPATYNITVVSNVLWTATSTDGTLSITDGGSASEDEDAVDVVEVSIPVNWDAEEKEYTVTFTGAGLTRTAKIIQAKNGVEINGVIWSSFNVDAPYTFVDSPEKYGKYYQFNRNIAYPGDDQPLAIPGWSTTDAAFDADLWQSINDPSPAGWRIPTETELQSLIGYLINNSTCLWTRAWNVNGLWIGENATSASNTNAQGCMFMPAAGRRNWELGEMTNNGIAGRYWTTSTISPILAITFFFDDRWYMMGTMSSNIEKSSACTIRCVKIQ
ncbi:MAG: hypothetical protein LBN95_10035 [Prevotellaceae bacterium]|jgi:uncharacterized protein (TIGR02145 family)|nr:hypothetical protein [Prevotellaceae bacterium]